MDDENDQRKAHNKRHAGRKAERKAEKTKHVQEYTDKQRNPKAFTYKSCRKAQSNFLRTQNLQHKKHHIPVVDRTPLEPPPVLIAIVGGPRSGKSTLLKSFIRIYTKRRLTSIAGPVTVVTGKTRRVTFVEVNNDINCMIDVAKVADVVLALIDVNFGIEMEVFEFLEICRAHGTPRIMGILNHLDLMKDNKSLKKKKSALKARFQKELYPGAKLFYLTGMIRDEYMIPDIKQIARFIANTKFRPLTFRSTHPYVYVDRWEDVTNPDTVRQNSKADRDLVLYGYVRGAILRNGQQVHIPGCGDHSIEDIQFLPDPCALPGHNKKRTLNDQEKQLYAPFSGVGGIVYDKDAVYIDLGGSQHGRYIMEQQQQQLQLQQSNQIKLNPNVNKEDSDDDNEGATDEEEEEAMKDDEKEEGEEQVDPEAPVRLMARLQEMQGGEPDTGSRNLQLFAGGASVRAVQQLQPHYNNPGELTKKGASKGPVRRRAHIPENEDYEGDAPQGEEDDEGDSDDERESDEEEGESDDEEEEESDEEAEDENSEESEDDDGVNKSKTISNGSSSFAASSEPPLKKRKVGASDAFSKIQDVLKALETNSLVTATPTTAASTTTDGEDFGYDSGNETNNMDTTVGTNGTIGADDEEHSSESENDEEGLEFQRAVFEEARDNYYKNQTSVQHLVHLIYECDDVQFSESLNDNNNQQQQEEPQATIKNPFDDDEDDDGFLMPVVTKHTSLDDVDTSQWTMPDPEAFRDSKVQASIRDCFVTGTWKESEDAATLLQLDDEDLYGDFEDLETGQKHEGKEGEEEASGDVATPAAPLTGRDAAAKRKQLLREKIEKKRKLGEMFDPEFEDKSTEYFDARKAEMKKQAQLNRDEFEELSDEMRVMYEGFRPGLYVRMHFKKMPCEFVVNFDPTYPVIVGGLLDNENKNVFNRVRMKVHRWYPKILKNRDPLILSVGWRRIQTMMYYGKREDDLKLRALKYAKKYLHVEAVFWGPYSPVGTGFVALQSVAKRVASFRIAANGVMLEADKTTKIVKKLKLIGHPQKVMQKTCFITDMFHSETEVAKFIGAKIQTQSGIRGLIKNHCGLKGDFRAKFEDTIKMSDVILLKTWADVNVERYCTYVRSLLLTPAEKGLWQGMKTVAEVKKANSIKNMPNPDSLYTDIKRRRQYVAKPLKVPRSLQEALPYKYKPKHERAVPEEDRVLIVKDPHEEKMDRFVNRWKELMEEKEAERKRKSREKKQKFIKSVKEKEAYRQNREKQRKIAACKKFSIKKSKPR